MKCAVRIRRGGVRDHHSAFGNKIIHAPLQNHAYGEVPRVPPFVKERWQANGTACHASSESLQQWRPKHYQWRAIGEFLRKQHFHVHFSISAAWLAHGSPMMLLKARLQLRTGGEARQFTTVRSSLFDIGSHMMTNGLHAMAIKTLTRFPCSDPSSNPERATLHSRGLVALGTTSTRPLSDSSRINPSWRSISSLRVLETDIMPLLDTQCTAFCLPQLTKTEGRERQRQ